MSSKFYEIDLLQKYRQTISKRYRGYNRVVQLDLNKLNEGIHAQKSSELQNEMKQYKKCKSPLIQIAKACFSESHYKKEIEQQSNVIIIKSSNAPLNLKQTKLQTEFNNRKFIKKKVIDINHVENLLRMNSNELENQLKNNKKSDSMLKIKNSSQQTAQNKFKYRKRIVKDSSPFINSEQGQRFLNHLQSMRFQPFSPIIKGQKKRTHAINTKSKTYENETLTRDQDTEQIRVKNQTQIQRQKQRKQKMYEQKLKRTNSYISQKSDGQENKSSSLTSSVEPTKAIKKFSTNFQSSKLASKDKIHPKSNNGVSFPKINYEKELICSKNTQKANNLVQVTQEVKKTAMDLQIEKNIEKYKKIPCLLKYQFDAKNIESQSYIVMEAQSQIILTGFRSSNPYQIASLTKIMTFWVILKLVEQYRIDSKVEMIQIDSKPSNIGGTSADLFFGEKYTLENLYYGLMLPSGNDAALALAAWGGKFKSSNPQDIQSCINQFVKLMNQQAKNLNLIDTRFGNPHGLPNKLSRSTAYDVARLCILCMKNQTFQKVVKCKSYKCFVTMADGKKRLNEWQNTNKLLRRQGFLGIKTGITITAGPCLASAYKFKGKTFITVLLRAKKVSRRFKQTRKILHWSLSKRYQQSLTQQQLLTLKKLKKNNIQLDSDYSDEQSEFKYDCNNSKQLRKRCDIISQM